MFAIIITLIKELSKKNVDQEYVDWLFFNGFCILILLWIVLISVWYFLF